MKEEHFKETNVEGVKYDFIFDNTHLIKRPFIKPEGWGPFTKIGELTEEGIRFVESNTNGQELIFWDDYKNQH